MNWIALTCLAVLLCGVEAYAQDASSGNAPKILVAFFSKTNNTRAIAEHIHRRVGGELFQVAPKNPYPRDYRQTTDIARRELDNNERPELAAVVSPEDMKNYDVVFLGYPIWWGTMPMAMFTFLEQYDLSGKTIIPFCTHGGSGLSRSAGDIEKSASGAVLKQALAVRNGGGNSEQENVDAWLRTLGYIK